MTNYMYHNNKEAHTSLDLVDDSSWQNYKKVTTDDFYENRIYYYDSSRIDNYEVTLDDIKFVCNKYLSFGDYTDFIIDYLINLGIYEGKSKNLTVKKKDEFILDSIKGEILWNLFLRNKLKE